MISTHNRHSMYFAVTFCLFQVEIADLLHMKSQLYRCGLHQRKPLNLTRAHLHVHLSFYLQAPSVGACSVCSFALKRAHFFVFVTSVNYSFRQQNKIKIKHKKMPKFTLRCQISYFATGVFFSFHLFNDFNK